MSSVLSVVVPVYNVAPYLDECLESIAAQYYRDLEVVMVDDGSCPAGQIKVVQGAQMTIADHGRAGVAEMNRLGMVINVAHASDQSILPQVVPRERLPRANARLYAVELTAKADSVGGGAGRGRARVIGPTL